MKSAKCKMRRKEEDGGECFGASVERCFGGMKSAAVKYALHFTGLRAKPTRQFCRRSSNFAAAGA